MALRFVHSDSKQTHLHWSDRDKSQTGVDGYENYTPRKSSVRYIVCAWHMVDITEKLWFGGRFCGLLWQPFFLPPSPTPTSFSRRTPPTQSVPVLHSPLCLGTSHPSSTSFSVVSFLSSGTIHSSQWDLRVVCWSESVSCSVVSESLWPCGLQTARPLCPWNSGKNMGVGSHSLLQGVFLTQGSNPCLQHCRQILYHLISFSVANKRIFMVRNAPFLHWVTSVGDIWNCCSHLHTATEKDRLSMSAWKYEKPSQSHGSTKTIFKSVVLRIWIPQSSVWCWL